MQAGLIRLKVVVQKDEVNKESHAQSAQMACESAANQRTVASLTREDDCCRLYSEMLDEPERASVRSALITNLGYSFTTG